MKKLNKISDKYFFEKRVGSGSFGEVYTVFHKLLDKDIAAKIENKRENSRLYDEYKIYRRLHRKGFTEGIPQYYEYLETPVYNILLMELLGDSLEKKYLDIEKKISIGSVLKLGIEIIKVIENFHKAGYIHRDIKPSNFMFNIENSYSDMKLYIVDFGLSKRYIINNEHIEMKTGRSLTGTARYASINVHNGIEPSRRDDIESIGYMLIYLLKGKLPWQGIKKTDVGQAKKDQIELIGDKKLCTSVNELCKDIPNIFIEYINYARKLKFTEKPDYKYLINLFTSYAKENNISLEYNF